jgi:hypothetical protein
MKKRSERKRETGNDDGVLSEAGKSKPLTRDYYTRLLKRQPKPLSAEETLQFWREERR